jgi:Domain of unknown function (DUF397)
MNDASNRQWRKSSFSGNTGNCVEVCTDDAGIVAVRDSKSVPGPELAVTEQAWSAFIRGVKHGEFDL